MAIRAKKAFKANAKDIDRLLELHADIGGDTPGRRYGLEVLNKSAIVLITAIWEAFCEDLAAEALEHIVERAKSAAALTKHIKQLVAEELKRDKDEIAVWQLSDRGWRDLLTKRLDRLTEQRNRRLNTPMSSNIDDLFLNSIGLKQVSDVWHWKKMSSASARKKLDKFIQLRGDIAHRGVASKTCKKVQLTDYFKHIQSIVEKTSECVNGFAKEATGKNL